MSRSVERANEVRKACKEPAGFGNEVIENLGKSRYQGGIQLAGGFRRELEFLMRSLDAGFSLPGHAFSPTVGEL